MDNDNKTRQPVFRCAMTHRATVPAPLAVGQFRTVSFLHGPVRGEPLCNDHAVVYGQPDTPETREWALANGWTQTVRNGEPIDFFEKDQTSVEKAKARLEREHKAVA